MRDCNVRGPKYPVLGAEQHTVVYSDLSLAAMLQVEVPVDERRGFRAVDTSIADASAAGEDPGDPLVGTPEHERRLVRSDSAKVPIELEDALRLQSLGRLMHRVVGLGSQVIATSLEPETPLFPADAKTFHVEHGRVETAPGKAE